MVGKADLMYTLLYSSLDILDNLPMCMAAIGGMNMIIYNHDSSDSKYCIFKFTG